jgi:carbon storage regulator
MIEPEAKRHCHQRQYDLGHWQKERAMLVLSLKPKESIVINENIIVTVLRVQGDKVQLGIEAPVEMPVHRPELHERIQNREVPIKVG